MHRRHELGVRGDERNVKVKLSNYITENLFFWNWNWLRLVYVLDCFSMVWLLFVTLACVMVLPCFAILFSHVFPVPCWSETERDFKTSSCFEQLCQYLIIFDIFRYILNIFELFWYMLILFDHVWSYLNMFCKFWGCLHPGLVEGEALWGDDWTAKIQCDVPSSTVATTWVWARFSKRAHIHGKFRSFHGQTQLSFWQYGESVLVSWQNWNLLYSMLWYVMMFLGI